jgi:hypothetical protein
MMTTRLLAIASALSLSVLMLSSPALASYGGTSSGYQSENREDDYYGFSCGSYNNNCFGRCGPGCSTYFGTTNTYQCQQHDACIRDWRCAGYSRATAHTKCLTGSRGLGRAAWSLVRYHWNNAKSYAKSGAISTWAKICSTC